MHKPRIVILLSRFPYPLEKGDKLRAYHQIKSLSESFDICLITISTFTIQQKDREQMQVFCSQIHVLQLQKWKAVCNTGLALLGKLPLQVAYYYQFNLQNQINAIVAKCNPEIVYVQLARMAKYAIDLPFEKVLDFQDAFSLNYARSALAASFPFNFIYQLEGRRMKNFEKKVLPLFDATTIISESDKISVGDIDITVVRNGVDSKYFSPIITPKIYDILFVGNLGYLPNVLAVETIVNDIFPKLFEINKSIKILIAGANPSDKIKNYANHNITIQAWMPDIRDAYSQAKIFVAPLHTGAGLQNKLLEAMSMQLPCITTSICNSSLHASPNIEVIIANKTDEFVASILQLLKNNNEQLQIGTTARNMILQKYDWVSANMILQNLLTSVINKT
jgi:polysaccharide biosynthesis protein PslH